MMNQKPSFRFEIDNFSEMKGQIVSQTFVSGGCKWFLKVFPKGEYLLSKKEIEYHLSLYLFVANDSLLQPGWKKTVNFYFAVLNQSNKELYRSTIACAEFDAKAISCGFPKTLPLSKFQDKGFLEEDKLIIEVYIKILEDVVGESGDSLEKQEVVDINGFRVFASQVTSVRKIFAEHPNIVTDFKLKNQVVRTEYMNVILRLVNTLNKPSEKISVNELGTGLSELKELTQMGFNLDWLKTKLVKAISLERITLNVDGSRIQELEERLKKLELMEFNLKLDSLKRKLDEVDSERKKAKADEPRVQKLEERVKNLEMMESSFMMDSLKSKLENVSLEQKKPYDADGSRIQELEESVEDLKKMVSDLKAKLDKDEAKSSDDEFFLVNDVA